MRYRRWLQGLFIVGMVLSLYLTYLHYVPTASTFCDIGAALDCGTVNTSPYAELDGIFYLLAVDLGLPVPMIPIPLPVAVMGFVTMAFCFSLVTGSWISEEKAQMVLLIILMLSTVFAFYLLAVEVFLLNTYCLYCLALDVVIVAALVMAAEDNPSAG